MNSQKDINSSSNQYSLSPLLNEFIQEELRVVIIAFTNVLFYVFYENSFELFSKNFRPSAFNVNKQNRVVLNINLLNRFKDMEYEVRIKNIENILKQSISKLSKVEACEFLGKLASEYVSLCPTESIVEWIEKTSHKDENFESNIDTSIRVSILKSIYY
ncbi:MAG TPA: hypothetical protein DHW49_04640 [Anaerolineae bacterium]|nr:hypothetical protein [Anaerolineae bacterium]